MERIETEIIDTNSEQLYDDFYKKLRRTIKRKLNFRKAKKGRKKKTVFGALAGLLALLPDLFHLAVRLLFDKSVPAVNKGALLAAIAYVIMPVDLMPDPIPALGWCDDLIVIAIALNKFLDTKDKHVAEAVKRYYAGDEKVFAAAEHTIEIVDAATEFFPKKLMRMIRSIFRDK